MSILTRFFIFPKLFVCYAYDAIRFGRSAHLFGPFKSRNTARAHLMRLAHSLEKGMALPAPRRGFGDSLAAAVLADLDSYIEKFSPDEASCCVLTIVESTLDFHARHGVDWPEHSLRAKSLRDQHEKVRCLFFTKMERGIRLLWMAACLPCHSFSRCMPWASGPAF